MFIGIRKITVFLSLSALLALLPACAQTDGEYQEALRRINEAADRGATSLTLENLVLQALPPEIGNLASLTRLYLNENQLTALPPEIGNLANLRGLSLEGNQLTALPPEIGNLANVRGLSLEANQLTALPPEIGNLANLTFLGLGGNLLPSDYPIELPDLLAYLREQGE